MANNKIGRGSNWSLEKKPSFTRNLGESRRVLTAASDTPKFITELISAELASKGYDRNAAQIKKKKIFK